MRDVHTDPTLALPRVAHAAARRSVVVVEDDDDARELLASLLEQRGYCVAAYANGADALDRLEREPAPSAVLLDLQMPIMDGYELHARMRKHPRLATIPVIVMTDLRTLDLARMGGTVVLQKPLRLKNLLSALERV